MSPQPTASLRPAVWGLSLMLAACLSSAGAWAQTAPPPPAGTPRDPNWAAIKGAALSTIDKQTVQKWVAAQFDQILAADDPFKPATEFFKTITTKAKPGSSAAFQQDMAQAIAEAFTARSSAISAAKPLGPVFILMTLREVGAAPSGATAATPALLSAYQAAIKAAAPAIRCQGMMGLALLGTANPPAVPAADRPNVIKNVQTVAAAETDPLVLDRMYKFLRSLGDAQAVLSTLNARLTRFEQKGEVPILADAEAAAWMADASRFRSLNAQTQTAVARGIARLMADAVYVYVHNAPPQELKFQLEQIATDAEQALTAVYRTKVPSGTPPAPSLSETFNQAGPKLNDNLTAVVGKWIGVAQTPGLLNPPQAFGLPIGLGIQRPAPTTATAPAV